MRVCLFDIDGTLLATGGAGKAAMEAALISEFGLSALIDGVPYSGRTDRAIGAICSVFMESKTIPRPGNVSSQPTWPSFRSNWRVIAARSSQESRACLIL